MKGEIANLLQKSLKKLDVNLKSEEIEKLIELPPSTDMGDFAFPCFFLAGKLKMSPQEIAINLREEIGNPPKSFSDIQTSGPYINFFVDRKSLAIDLIQNILNEKENYGRVSLKKPITTMVEFVSPNTNKPLHIGHLRNMSLGESVSRISEFNGEKIVRANMNNDRGIHICKSMWAYKNFGKNSKPTKKLKSDHFVGKYYALYGQKEKENPAIEIEAHEMLRLWEHGNSEVRALWEKMNRWAFDGWKQTLNNFGIKFEKEYYESEIYQKGKEIVEQGLKEKLFEKNKDGAIVINLEKEGLGEKVLLRIDGTSVYITSDLYLAQLKFKEYNLDKSIYVVANEQDYHFKVLFTILKKLGFEDKGLYHLSYGMIRLPEGKIKSREGTQGISVDEILDNVQNLVKKEIKKRSKLSKKELESRSLKISLAAIKYAVLKVDAKKNMIFNPKESISLEGDTGPYIQYAYARASSILKKAKISKDKKLILNELQPKEIELIKQLSNFKQVVQDAYSHLNPSLVATYSYRLAQIFNEFYHESQVIGSEQEIFRLNLIESFRIILKKSLYLIGIDVLETM